MKSTHLHSIFITFADSQPGEVQLQHLERVTDPETSEVYRESYLPVMRFGLDSATADEKKALKAALGTALSGAHTQLSEAQARIQELEAEREVARQQAQEAEEHAVHLDAHARGQGQELQTLHEERETMSAEIARLTEETQRLLEEVGRLSALVPDAAAVFGADA